MFDEKIVLTNGSCAAEVFFSLKNVIEGQPMGQLIVWGLRGALLHVFFVKDFFFVATKLGLRFFHLKKKKNQINILLSTTDSP